VQLAVSFDEPFELTFDDQLLKARAAVVPSGSPHAFETGGRRIGYALVEPSGRRGALIAQRARELHGRDIAAMLSIDDEPHDDAEAAIAFADGLLDCLSPRTPRARPLSGPVVAALGYLDASIHGHPRLTEAACAAHLSPSRLTHRFSEEVGIPFRRFVLWLRLRRAAEERAKSTTLTEAAIAAGFSDLSHLNRVCRATFGVSPSALREMQITAGSWPV
jgi:AraC-like DNA-binding protein